MINSPFNFGHSLVVAIAAFLVPVAGQGAQPAFESARVVGTNFIMVVSGLEGASGDLEATDALWMPWVPVALSEPVTNGELSVSVDRPGRYFRIRSGELLSQAAGYVKRELTAGGLSLIANPFVTGNNRLGEVLGEEWEMGTTVYRFDGGRQAYYATQFGTAQWLGMEVELGTGQGAFVLAASARTLTLGGLVVPALVEPVNGWNLLGYPAGVSEVRDAEEGDQWVRIRNGAYQIHAYEFGEWVPAPPSMAVGEGFWYFKNRQAAERPAGGAILFSNIGSLGTAWDAPQFDPYGCKWEGDLGLATLYAGGDGSALQAVGAPVPFMSGAGAGFFDTGSNAVRYVEGVSAGAVATVEVRMWESGYESYEEALADGGTHGRTMSIEVYTGGAGDPPSLPASLTGLTASGGMGSLLIQVTGGGKVFVGSRVRIEVIPHPYFEGRTVSYQWRRGDLEGSNSDRDITGATGPAVEWQTFQVADEGLYHVWVEVGGCAAGYSFPVELKAVELPTFSELTNEAESGVMSFVFEGNKAYDYVIEKSVDLKSWSVHMTLSRPAGPVTITDAWVPQQRFYRARIL